MRAAAALVSSCSRTPRIELEGVSPCSRQAHAGKAGNKGSKWQVELLLHCSAAALAAAAAIGRLRKKHGVRAYEAGFEAARTEEAVLPDLAQLRENGAFDTPSRAF